MSTATMTETTAPFETRLIPVSQIHVPEGFAPTEKKTVDALVKSIADDGLLQAIGVRPDGKHKDGLDGYALVFGRHRLTAVTKLGESLIAARVIDIGPEDAECLMHAENLFRRVLDRKSKLAAIAAYAKHYKTKHPEVHGQGAATKTKRRKPADAESLPGRLSTEPADDGKPADEPATLEVVPFAARLAEETGVSRATAFRDTRVAERLDDEQRAALLDRNVPMKKIAKVAAIKSNERRSDAVKLIASGMDVDRAILIAKSPTGTADTVIADNSGVKAEADMTDDEWYEACCGDFAKRLSYTVAYKADAILWRRIRDARTEFRNKTKNHLSQSKVKTNGPFRRACCWFVNLAHPKDWLVCGPCGGTGVCNDTSHCPKCNGHAFAIQTSKA